MLRNFMYFGRRTPKNRSGVFTRPPYILHSTSLPGFAHGGEKTELDQTLPNGRKQIAPTICRKNLGLSLPKSGVKTV